MHRGFSVTQSAMRRLAALLSLLAFASAVAAADSSQDEQHFLASLRLGRSPQVRYLDAAGKPLDYASFAQQWHAGRRHYSITRDSHAGAAVLRLRPAGAHSGEPGRFAFGRGDTFPPFELPSLQGGLRRLSDMRGRYTLVSFFFAECVPCNAEVPVLNAYAREHGDMNFLAITYEDAASARQFAQARGLTWPVLYGGLALTDTLGVGTYPTLMLIDPSGRVAGAAVGMSMADDDATRLAGLSHWVVQWRQALSAQAHALHEKSTQHYRTPLHRACAPRQPSRRRPC